MWFFFVCMQRYLIWGCIVAIQILQLELSCVALLFYFMSTSLSELQQHLESHLPPDYFPFPDMRWHHHNHTLALLEWNQLLKEWL